MNNLKYFITLCVIISFNSCDVLDEDPFTQPSTENFYKNATDAQAALTPVYARLKSGNGYYKQGFLSTLIAASDQGLSSYLFNDFKRGIVTSDNQSINNFVKTLTDNGVNATVRREKGSDIDAACGQLRAKKEDLI